MMHRASFPITHMYIHRQEHIRTHACFLLQYRKQSTCKRWLEGSLGSLSDIIWLTYIASISVYVIHSVSHKKRSISTDRQVFFYLSLCLLQLLSRILFPFLSLPFSFHQDHQISFLICLWWCVANGFLNSFFSSFIDNEAFSTSPLFFVLLRDTCRQRNNQKIRSAAKYAT